MAGRGSSGELGLGHEIQTNPVPMMVSELAEVNIVKALTISTI